jgi:hypothetical protein
MNHLSCHSQLYLLFQEFVEKSNTIEVICEDALKILRTVALQVDQVPKKLLHDTIICIIGCHKILLGDSLANALIRDALTTLVKKVCL